MVPWPIFRFRFRIETWNFDGNFISKRSIDFIGLRCNQMLMFFFFISVCFMRLFTYQTIMYGTSRPRVIPTRMRVSQRRIFPTAPTSSAQTGISYTAFFHSPRALELANWRLPSLPLSIILFYALTVRVFHALFFPSPSRVFIPT